MKTPLAWHNLLHSKMRTATAVAGVTFAVVLIFMQTGFLGMAAQTSGMIYDALDFDFVVRSRQYRRLSDAATIARSRLYTIASTRGVASVAVVHVAPGQWRNPVTGRKRMILTIGVQPESRVFKLAEIQHKEGLLETPEFVLIDRKSRSEFGPANGVRFGNGDLGAESEVARRTVRIVGTFSLGAGFESDGAILLDERGFLRIHPERTSQEVSLGLIKLSGDAQAESVAARLQSALPPDVQVLSRADVLGFERNLWVREMPVGIMFQFGVAVALIVGTAIVYQVLSSDVANHLAEYATLKAIGYGSGYLCSVVLQQAIAMALLGFLPGLAIAEALYCVTERMTNLPISMNVGRIVLVLTLSLTMCIVSGLAAVRKVRRADPADLF
jgi:putative ABC transport system permease protein